MMEGITMKKIRIATVFSGIGAPEQALKKLNIPFEIVFACDNGDRVIKDSYSTVMKHCEDNGFNAKQVNEYVKKLYDDTKKENYVKQSYFSNYDISDDRWYEDIRFVDGREYKGKVDIYIGGSPCQSFSAIGKRGGLEDARGTLFYEYARLVKEMEPSVFIYENVPGMLTHDKGNTWKTIKDIFYSLGYDIYFNILNAVDYGIPQDRKRLFVVGFKSKKEFKFPEKIELKTTMFDYLEDAVDAKHYLGKKGFEFVTNPFYKNRARVNHEIIQTQKANQQFNWNGDFVFEELDKVQNIPEIMQRAYVGEYEGKNGVVRQLSYRECYRLMGFADDFKIIDNNVQAYRQAGNSIVVNVLESVFKSILDVEDFSSNASNNDNGNEIDKCKKSEKKNVKINIATVFSGIGAVEFALKRMGIKYNIVFACDNGDREITYDIGKEREYVRSLKSTEEKKEYVENLYANSTKQKNYVQMSYEANYPELEDNMFYQDVILLDGRDYEGKVDLFVGGSPCQSFSSVGFQGGLEDARGTLFYEYARLVSEIKPKVFIYENVRNLLNHDHGKTWEVIKKIFDNLGYSYSYDVLNSADYGVPQTRRRLFVVGFRNDLGINVNDDFVFPPEKQKLEYVMKDFCINSVKFGGFTSNIDGKLELSNEPGTVDDRYILSEKIYNYVMKSGTKTWVQKVEINKDVARTLLKTMGNRHRAGVDNYVSFDGTENLGSVRMLTEREAHRLMGFTDDYKIVVSRAQAYKQAGNSIVVDVLIEVLKSILNTNVFERG